MTTWMLLEHSADLLAKLFRHVDLPDFVPVFDSTELALYSAHGPLLVKDDDQGKLSTLMRQTPTDWPGLMIESEHKRDALLIHLRHILLIRLGSHGKGMLRYWNPSVASHLFSACADESRDDWLGPISVLYWHSAGTTGWQTLDNPNAISWLGGTKPLLTLSVEQRLALNLKSLPTASHGQES